MRDVKRKKNPPIQTSEKHQKNTLKYLQISIYLSIEYFNVVVQILGLDRQVGCSYVNECNLSRAYTYIQYIRVDIKARFCIKEKNKIIMFLFCKCQKLKPNPKSQMKKNEQSSYIYTTIVQFWHTFAKGERTIFFSVKATISISRFFIPNLLLLLLLSPPPPPPILPLYAVGFF